MGKTVRERFDAPDKDEVFARLESAGYDVEDGGVGVLVGRLRLEQGMRLTEKLLKDVESLLIKRLQPSGNIKCRLGRISRPGMRLECRQEWPHRRSRFVDIRPRIL